MRGGEPLFAGNQGVTLSVETGPIGSNDSGSCLFVCISVARVPKEVFPLEKAGETAGGWGNSGWFP